MRVIVHPDAQAELDQAAAFYGREGSVVLAARFVAEFKRVTGLLLAHPGIGAPRSRNRRGFGMNVFPYTVIYQVTDDAIHVLVVKHDKRRPGHGESRG